MSLRAVADAYSEVTVSEAPSGFVDHEESLDEAQAAQEEERIHRARTRLLARTTTEHLSRLMDRDMNRNEADLLHKVSNAIVSLQEHKTAWMGLFAPRMRSHIGNPSDEILERLVLPPAYHILRQADRNRQRWYEVRRNDHRGIAEAGGLLDLAAQLPERVLSLDDALEGAFRFFLCEQYNDAKLLLSIALCIYPHEIRLYKLYSFIFLSHKTLRWREAALEQLLVMCDGIYSPDAEIWAVRGDIAAELWRLNQNSKHLFDQAMVSYLKSFQMCRDRAIRHAGSQPASPRKRHNHGPPALAEDNSSPLTEALVYGIERAALLCVDMYEFALAQNQHKLVALYKQHCSDYLMELRNALHQWELKFGDKIKDRHLYYGMLLSSVGVGDVRQAETYSAFLKAELDRCRKKWEEQYATPAAMSLQHSKTAYRLDSLQSLASAGGTPDDHCNPTVLFSSPEDPLMHAQNAHEITQLSRLVLFAGIPFPDAMAAPSQWHVAWKVVHVAYSTDVVPTSVQLTSSILRSCVQGGVGLAMGGDGLRAAFLHLGVFARLAECDVLRNVSTLSCVGGGSMVGAHYYLLVKELLESKADGRVTQDDYIDLVHTMIAQFSQAAEQNVLADSFLNPWSNLKVGFGLSSRVEFIGEQLQNSLFHYAVTGPATIVKHIKHTLKMRSMRITPFQWRKDALFSPAVHNYTRNAKVPSLDLNCANVATGHLWRFSLDKMGEVAALAGGDSGVDRLPLLESVRYTDAPLQEHKDMSFADCIAISATPPSYLAVYDINGLFGQYPVRLVSGSVLDRTGMTSLFHGGVDIDVAIVHDMTAPLAVQLPISKFTGAVTEHSTFARRAALRDRILSVLGENSQRDILRELPARLSSQGLKDACYINLRGLDLLSAHHRESINYNRRVRVQPVSSYLLSYSRTAEHNHSDDPYPERWGRPGASLAPSSPLAVLLESKHHSRQSIDSAASDYSVDLHGSVDMDDHKAAANHRSNGHARRRNSVDARLEEQKVKHFAHAEPQVLNFGHLLQSQLLDMREDLGRLTEIERNALMAAGYRVASESLQACSQRDHQGGQFSQLMELLPSSAYPPNSKQARHARAQATLSNLSGTSKATWAHFNVVDNKNKNWAFSPLQEVIECADRIQIQPVSATEEPLAYVDHMQHARAVRSALKADGGLTVDLLTDNPALSALYKHLQAASQPSPFRRALDQSLWMTLGVLFLVALLLGLVLWGVLSSFTQLLDDHSFFYRKCLCVLEEPLFYLTLLGLFYVLFIFPGWLWSVVRAVLVEPTWSLTNKLVLGPLLAHIGSQQRLLDAHRTHLATQSMSKRAV